jgi:hypothetical protein
LSGIGAGERSGASAQATSRPRISADQAPDAQRRTFDMWVILLEAFGAMVLLLLIVWWTMFSGRRRGERRDDRP